MRLAQEEMAATHNVFRGDLSLTNDHFTSVGLALGLVRIKDIHAGIIIDLEQEVKEQESTQDVKPSDTSKS